MHEPIEKALSLANAQGLPEPDALDDAIFQHSMARGRYALTPSGLPVAPNQSDPPPFEAFLPEQGAAE